jgi:hypothetical protein
MPDMASVVTEDEAEPRVVLVKGVVVDRGAKASVVPATAKRAKRVEGLKSMTTVKICESQMYPSSFCVQ